MSLLNPDAKLTRVSEDGTVSDVPTSNDHAAPRLTKTPPLTHIEVDIAYLKQCGPIHGGMPWEQPPNQEYETPPKLPTPPYVK